MSLATTQRSSYDETVAGWADHLRSGGTTTWSAWLADPRPGVPVRPRPDAAHLELVRRLNLTAGDPLPELADRVLATASPGRGLVDIPLPWPTEPRRFGTPAIDPDRLPDDELIRLATGVIVHLLPTLPRPDARHEPRRWTVPWRRRRFRLHGTPGTVAAVRRGLLEQGHVESDWRPTHVVIARSVEAMMAEQWAANARAGGILKWSTLWRRAEAAGGLPAELDVAAIADRLEGGRREPVHVVVARDTQGAVETTARLLGARPFVVDANNDLAATDLMRRVNRLIAVVEGPARVRDLASRLVATLDDAPPLEGPPPAPVVPAASLAWAQEHAATAARRLRAAGYSVHGNPDDLAPAAQRRHSRPGSGPGSGRVDRTRTLELAVAACLRTWRLQGGTP